MPDSPFYLHMHHLCTHQGQAVRVDGAMPDSTVEYKASMSDCQRTKDMKQQLHILGGGKEERSHLELCSVVCL